MSKDSHSQQEFYHKTLLFETYDTRWFEGRKYVHTIVWIPFPTKAREGVQHDVHSAKMCTVVRWCCCMHLLLLRRCPHGEHHIRFWNFDTIQAQATCHMETNKTTHTYLGTTPFSKMSVTQTTPDVKIGKVHRKRGHRSFPKVKTRRTQNKLCYV